MNEIDTGFFVILVENVPILDIFLLSLRFYVLKCQKTLPVSFCFKIYFRANLPETILFCFFINLFSKV